MYTFTLSEYAMEHQNCIVLWTTAYEHLIFTEITQIPDDHTDNCRKFGPDHWG